MLLQKLLRHKVANRSSNFQMMVSTIGRYLRIRFPLTLFEFSLVTMEGPIRLCSYDLRRKIAIYSVVSYPIITSAPLPCQIVHESASFLLKLFFTIQLPSFNY